MYEMLTGEKPYQGKRTVEILQQLFSAPVPEVRLKNRNVNRKLSDLIYRMMAKERKERPRNWQVFCAEVEELIESEYPVLANSAETSFAPGRNKLAKGARYVAFTLAGFALCFMIFSGKTLREKLRGAESKAALAFIGEEYRSQCVKYRLLPPLSLIFASDAVKQSWINSNKKEFLPQPPVQPVKVSAFASLGFEISIAPEAKEYLKMKNYALTVSGGEHFSDRKIPLSGGKIDKLAPGKYTLQMSVPECRAIPPVSVELTKDTAPPVKVTVVPLEATLKIECGSGDFKVWWNNVLQETKAVKTDSLRSGELVIQSEGYKLFTDTVKLYPGEIRIMEVSLEKKLPPDSENMRRANKAFAEKRYATAKKLYRREAEREHPLAMYNLGVIFEQGLGAWGASYEEAFKYYRMAALKEFPDAIFKTGEFFENGKGGVRNSDTEALKWYRLGARKNHRPCQVKVALFYEDGRGGLKKDLEKALQLFLENAGKGDAVSQFHAGRIYERKLMLETIHSKRDAYKKAAKRLYEAAARQGHDEAGIRRRGL